LRTTISIAELRTKKSCGTAIADLQILTSAIPQLSAAPANSATFWYLILSSGWFKKSTKIIFRTICFSAKQKLALKGQLHEIF
jgi:hypothetical protein